MVLYRRNRVAGGTYFFTVTLRDRRARTLIEYIEPLRHAVRETRRRRPFEIEAMVVLPEHLHAMWTLPPGDDDYSGRWKSVKSLFTRGLKKAGVKVEKNARGEHGLWQRRYWEHTIRDEDDFRRHVDYIHFNPLKHGWVTRVRDWPYSTFHKFVDRGIYPVDWGGDGVAGEYDGFGER